MSWMLIAENWTQSTLTHTAVVDNRWMTAGVDGRLMTAVVDDIWMTAVVEDRWLTSVVDDRWMTAASPWVCSPWGSWGGLLSSWLSAWLVPGPLLASPHGSMVCSTKKGQVSGELWNENMVKLRTKHVHDKRAPSFYSNSLIKFSFKLAAERASSLFESDCSDYKCD